MLCETKQREQTLHLEKLKIVAFKYLTIKLCRAFLNVYICTKSNHVNKAIKSNFNSILAVVVCFVPKYEIQYMIIVHNPKTLRGLVFAWNQAIRGRPLKYSERPRTERSVYQTGRKSVRLSIVQLSNVRFIYSERSKSERSERPKTERSVYFFTKLERFIYKN